MTVAVAAPRPGWVRRHASQWCVACGVVACGPVEPQRPVSENAPSLEILAVWVPSVVRAGSPIDVQVRGVAADEVVLVIDAGTAFDVPLTASRDAVDRLQGNLPAAAARVIDDGGTTVGLSLRAPGARSPSLTERWRSAGAPAPEILAIEGDALARNALLAFPAVDLLLDGEGTNTLHVEGTFTPPSGPPRPLAARLPVLAAERFARDRATVRLSSALGGVGPGVIDAVASIEVEPTDGAAARSPSVGFRGTLADPVVLRAEPEVVSVGALLSLHGVGFVGDAGDETTLVRLDGAFDAEGRTAAVSLELVPAYESDQRLVVTVPWEVADGRLACPWFDAAEGQFSGQVAVSVFGATDMYDAGPTPISLTLAPPRQVIQLDTTGLAQGLDHFGLASATAQVTAAVAARLAALFAGYRVDFRIAPVADFAPGSFSLVEIGGADPNGAGLLGYDNTPGKDVGNVRLGDRIGGLNAETQEDGAPGYGGVFVESFLYWSSHPDLPGIRPSGSPEVDPLFDVVFDALRAQPATLDEARGTGSPARVAAVAEAIRALAWVIAETTAHEIGHSLGLAAPYGPAEQVHELGDAPGCIMEAGAHRPFGERAGLDGYTPSQFCAASAAYLTEILGEAP